MLNHGGLGFGGLPPSACGAIQRSSPMSPRSFWSVRHADDHPLMPMAVNALRLPLRWAGMARGTLDHHRIRHGS